MKEQLQNRLVALKAEFETGQQRLAEVENQAATLRQTLLRISDAIQVLEELLVAPQVGNGGSSDAAASSGMASPEAAHSASEHGRPSV